MHTDTDTGTDVPVLVVGAGPVGLMLACELRLAGADVLVVERKPTRDRTSRGVGFTARATELFEQRGLLARLGETEISRQGHFGGIPLDFGVLEGSHFGVRGVPQYRVEEMLEDRARELGVRVERGGALVALESGPGAVRATVDGPGGRRTHRAGWLVGCDGGRSAVRRLAGFDFPGSDATREMYLADVAGADIRPRPIGERVPGGMVMSGPLEPGLDRIIVCPVGAPPPGDQRTVTFDVVADAWEQLTGQRLHGETATWVSAFTDATRQVSRYRQGRVLLAGDAAHIHLPAGGQGLSLGVQDAVNLGWKLAATVAGTAPDGLLDTYHQERHPVGARVLRNTLAQGMLYLSGADIDPMRAVMAELVALPDVARHLSGMVSGLDVRYDVGAAGHPLLGLRMPDGDVEPAAGGRTRLARLLSHRGVLLTTGPVDRYADAVAGRVGITGLRAFPTGVPGPTESVLVRPDGYVAWSAPGGGDLPRALARWFGPAAVPSTAH